MNPDAIADAACAKAAHSPKGSKRDRERVAKKARLVALALNVKAMRISMRINLGIVNGDDRYPTAAGSDRETRTSSNTANPLGGSARSGEGPA